MQSGIDRRQPHVTPQATLLVDICRTLRFRGRQDGFLCRAGLAIKTRINFIGDNLSRSDTHPIRHRPHSLIVQGLTDDLQ